jgi:hypothetical protein
MQSPRELQQLNNWSVNAEIRITARQSHVENDRKTNTHLSIGLVNFVIRTSIYSQLVNCGGAAMAALW